MLFMDYVDGKDMLDTTATSNDILFGKTAYINGEKVVGKLRVLEPRYQPIEYIESNGQQWINTGVKPTKDVTSGSQL